MSNHDSSKFWVHDPSINGHKGHPRVLVAFRQDPDKGTVTYAATTWNPKETDKYPFSRRHALQRVEGRLACPHRSRTIDVKACGVRMSIIIDLVERDDHMNRTDTARYAACQNAYEQRLWQVEIAPAATASL